MAARKSMGSYKCEKCDRTFSMAAHLARHLSTIHASPAAKAKAAAKKSAKKGVVKRTGAVGRPTGLVTRLGLRDMSLEQLREVIDAARLQAQVKLDQYRAAFL